MHQPLIHIYTHTKFQWNPPKRFQDKVPDGWTDGRTERRTDNAKTISLRLWRGIITVYLLNSIRKMYVQLQQKILNKNIFMEICPKPLHSYICFTRYLTQYTYFKSLNVIHNNFSEVKCTVNLGIKVGNTMWAHQTLQLE